MSAICITLMANKECIFGLKNVRKINYTKTGFGRLYTNCQKYKSIKVEPLKQSVWVPDVNDCQELFCRNSNILFSVIINRRNQREV